MVIKKKMYYVSETTGQKLDRREFFDFVYEEAANKYMNWDTFNESTKEICANQLFVRFLDLGLWKQITEEESQETVYCVEVLKIHEDPCLAIQSNISLFSSRIDAEDFVKYQTVEGIMLVYHKTQEEAEELAVNEDLRQIYLENALGNGPKMSIKLTEKQII